MVNSKAVDKYREFHLKDPDAVLPLSVEIPRIVTPIGFCSQVSYRSNKWNPDNKWIEYIHWWENPTLVCVDHEAMEDYDDLEFRSDQKFDLGKNRRDITFLGYAMDFNLTNDDRSKIVINPGKQVVRHLNPETEEESARVEDSYLFEFNQKIRKRNPIETGKDYVVCSPNGHIVYIICTSSGEVFCFMNPKCIVTRHGIEG
jgi:hypothetical protein